MKNKTFYFSNIIQALLFCIVLFLLVMPVVTLASPASYTPLEPIPALGGNSVTLASYIPNLVKLIIQIAGALAVIMIVIGGVQYLSTDAVGGKSEGKERITNAIYGLLLVIGAFIILNTIDPGILNLNLTIRPVTPGSGGGTTPPPPPPGGWIGRPWPASWPGGAPSPTHASVLATLTGSGFPVKFRTNRGNTNCTTIGQACTSLDGLSPNALAGLQRLSILADAWGGFNFITITGGTEYWMHDIATPLPQRADPNINRSSHRPGGGAIDLSRNSTLDSLIKAQTNVTGNQSCIGGSLPAYKIGTAIYVQEDAVHWHVCY